MVGTFKQNMAGTSKQQSHTSGLQKQPLSLMQWNCRGFKDRKKRAHLGLYLETFQQPSAIVTLQETGAAVKLTGYNAYQRHPLTCILVQKSYTAQEIDLQLNLPYSY